MYKNFEKGRSMIEMLGVLAVLPCCLLVESPVILKLWRSSKLIS